MDNEAILAIASFIRAVCERPDDDVVRLAFADWLDEHDGAGPCGQCDGGWLPKSGTPDRGMVSRCLSCSGSGSVPNNYRHRAEFIRLQCELADPRYRSHLEWTHACENPDCRPCNLRRRERELLLAHQGEWMGEVCREMLGRLVRSGEMAPGDVSEFVTFHRGFVESVTCTAAAFLGRECGCSGLPSWRICDACKNTGRTLDIAAELFRVQPIMEVNLGDKRPNYGRYDGWWWGDARATEELRDAHWVIDRRVYSYLKTWYKQCSVNRYYRSEKDAIQDLSQALVAFGRKKAGLPDWSPQTVGDK